MYNLTEKREYVRIELENRNYKEIETPCIAKFHTKQCADNENYAPDWDIVSVKNLSAGGMVFVYDKDLGIDSIINISFEISQSIPTISCVGKVLRIEERRHLSGYCIAIQFTEMSAKIKEEINGTIEEILRKKTKKKSFSFNRIVKMVSFMKRGEVALKPLQDNSPILDKENMTGTTACCSCNTIISQDDLGTGSAREKYGQLYCRECSTILLKKEERENSIVRMDMYDADQDTVAERSINTDSDTLDETVRDECTEMVSNRIERVENRVEEVYDEPELFSENEKLRRVTFRLPKFAAPLANSVHIVGDFNDWNAHCNPMKKERNGDHTLSLELEPGNSYKFGYLIDSVLVGLSSCSIKMGDNVEENGAICLQ